VESGTAARRRRIDSEESPALPHLPNPKSELFFSLEGVDKKRRGIFVGEVEAGL